MKNLYHSNSSSNGNGAVGAIETIGRAIGSKEAPVLHDWIKREVCDGSAVCPSLAEVAVEVRPDLEIADGEVVGTPIHDALNWKYTRFGESAVPSMEGLFFLQESGDAFQVKLSKPRPNESSGKLIKYENPIGNGSRGYFPAVEAETREAIRKRLKVSVPGPDECCSFWQWVKEHPEVPIVFTEGAKKSLALLSAGYVAIALNGVNGGYSVKDPLTKQICAPALIPDLQDFNWENRPVTILFDADNKPKTIEKVNRAVARFAPLLNQAKAIVFRGLWDPEIGKGIDDVIVNRGVSAAETIIKQAHPIRNKKLTHIQLASMLAEQFPIEYNELRLEPEIGRSELDIDTWRIDLLNQIGWDIPKETFIDAVIAKSKKSSYHPVVEYLSKLPKYEGNAKLQLQQLFSSLLSLDPESQALQLKLMVKWFVGAVKRVHEPGVFFKNVLILQSRTHDAGKSSFFRILAGDDWFSDTQAIGNAKDDTLVWHSCWIGEISEFEHIRKHKDDAQLKNWISSPTDFIRAPYEKRYLPRKRRFVLCATTNTDKFLSDQTGSVRFWVVTLKEGFYIDLGAVAAARDEVWACAMKLYLNGYSTDTTIEEKREYQEQNQAFQLEQSFEAYLDGYLEKEDRVSIALFRKELDRLAPGLRVSDQSIAAALTQRGWKWNSKQETEILNDGTRIRTRFYYPAHTPPDFGQSVHTVAHTPKSVCTNKTHAQTDFQESCTHCTHLNTDLPPKKEGENTPDFLGSNQSDVFSVQCVQNLKNPSTASSSSCTHPAHTQSNVHTHPAHTPQQIADRLKSCKTDADFQDAFKQFSPLPKDVKQTAWDSLKGHPVRDRVRRILGGKKW